MRTAIHCRKEQLAEPEKWLKITTATRFSSATLYCYILKLNGTEFRIYERLST